jgi:hypothetical protein
MDKSIQLEWDCKVDCGAQVVDVLERRREPKFGRPAARCACFLSCSKSGGFGC